ncbi:DUF6371 domain-containing protein [Nafulsella turpanensis]|uniref:DUF6371 domain-containing protein n=1 Tax=Nafulsella turpanensis TaxID=1265690 RepID=UPI0012689A3E|nr:DUF6371 domain-containing protein [Nafulsella turpanensis]
MSTDVFHRSHKGYEENLFVRYLRSIFPELVVTELVSRYHIGTSKHWPGATVFWQVDTNGRVRAGKIMLYDPYSGTRVKKPFNHVYWAHTALNLSGFKLEQCFFGEHLLEDNTKPVAVVESEKTAIIASAYIPDFVWLASGGASNLNARMCKVLKGRMVYFFPDLNAYDKWQEKAAEFSRLMPETSFQVDTLLEIFAAEKERKKGCDLADYLISFNHRKFHSQEEVQICDKPSVQKIAEDKLVALKINQDAAFERLKEKYPNLCILTDRLKLDIVGRRN